jgi:hypothetical protein
VPTERTSAITGRPRRTAGLRRSLALVIGLVALFAQSAPGPANASHTWTTNLYDARAFLYQDPYGTACTAASTMIMLNTIAYRKTGGAAFRWTPTRVKNDANRSNTRDMTSILWFSRSRDTLSAFGAGSDPHGWRNALNYYGWGSAAMTNSGSSVYADLQYSSYDAAVHAAVRAIARYRMPVGILAWAGRHAQVMTGYVVDGENPATSDAFTVRYVYLSDPLYSDFMVNRKVSNATFKNGTWRVRFQAYREADSPYDDPYRAGWKRSSVTPTRGPSEWYRRWVIVAPVRTLVPPVDPPPTPTPTPPPTPTPIPTPPPTPDPTPSPTASPTPTPTPTPALPDATATPTAPRSSDPEPSNNPSVSP